ncbi:nucleophile aminohydrolase [Holotrichia oblita]|uniref:Nucleophile aminohydrolase n=1 Tax=Holotrichia oblita TaxID=644536 RepID=A0ACB9SS33_HOLOL|nr:nucleophile aminohydrolase [Holotrichia oblita]
MEEMKFTQKDIHGIDYIYNLANATLNTYNEYNFWSEFHQGTASNIAVMDLDDFYVSLIIGMHASFGSQQMTNDGYITDNKASAPYTILPVIATDARFICAKRIVLGLNDVCVATQIISNWAYSTEDATTIIEYPRFTYLNNSLIGLEDDHPPKYSDNVISELQKLVSLNTIKEPYTSCNFVEKIFDNLNSHSDSRGGGISSRF